MITLINVPTTGNTTCTAKVIYHKQGTLWAVTKLIGDYWNKYGIKANKQYSAITYVKEGDVNYGYELSVRRNVYYKDIPVGKRKLNQKELIAFCKELNKLKHTYESLNAMGSLKRKQYLGTL